MNSFVAVIVLGLCAMASAHYEKAGALAYHGKYGDHCAADGIYWRDQLSFVLCSNGNAYVQPCAPGSSNFAYELYNDNEYYTNAFCGQNYATANYPVGHHYPYQGYPYGGYPYYPYYNYQPYQAAPAYKAHAKTPYPEEY